MLHNRRRWLVASFVLIHHRHRYTTG